MLDARNLGSEFIINNLISFANSKMSKYYTYLEYKEALEIIKVATKKGVFNEVFNLFTNINVSFMDDKVMLFEIAYSYDKEKIENASKEFDKIGYINSNIENLFSGVDNRVFSKIIDKKVLRKINTI